MSHTILLKPRPYAQTAGLFLVLPLLPLHCTQTLPAELWYQIFQLLCYPSKDLLSILCVSKTFKEIALPLLYVNVELTHISSLQTLCQQITQGDQNDSLRRGPYSAPGRWCQTIDLSNLPCSSQQSSLQLDTILTGLFPLLPLLTELALNPSQALSQRAILSLLSKDGIQNMRSLTGISYTPGVFTGSPDTLVRLIKNCTGLEMLEVIGKGPEPVVWEVDEDSPGDFIVLDLPHLTTVTLLSMPSSPLMLSLIMSSLPSLRKLTVTPYDDIPYPATHVSQLILQHGSALRSLMLFTPKSWPTRLHPSPQSLLDTCPRLNHLSLETPIPNITLETPHSLQILSIPRPSAQAWSIVEKLIPFMPSLCVVRARDVRWLRSGMTSKALEAGVQGELRDWRRRLLRHRIRVVDADWQGSE